METLNLSEQVKEMIIRRLGLEKECYNLSNDSLLFDSNGWGLDSIDAFEIVVGLEMEFNYKLKNDKIVESLTSINKIVDLLSTNVSKL